MENSVCFRDFEERDIDFIYKCKNNEKLWEYTVGDFHPFSYEEAVEWVHGCMQDDPTYKFWAICKNDDTKDIVGWCSISKIDFEKKSAKAHGIVIGDIKYNDGFSFLETTLFVLHYVFDVLNFETVTTCWFSNHPVSSYIDCYASLDTIKQYTHEGKTRNIEYVSISKTAYNSYKLSGDLEIMNIMQKIVKFKNSLMAKQSKQ